MDHDSDHFPIETRLDVSIKPAGPIKRPCYDRTDKKILQENLSANIPCIPTNQHPATLDQFVDSLVAALNKAIEVSTPNTTVSMHATPGFTEECKNACTATTQQRRRLKALRARNVNNLMIEEAYCKYKRLCQKKKSLIKRTLRSTHRSQIGEAAGNLKKTWKLVKWVTNRQTPYKASTPLLKKPESGIAMSRQEKAQCLTNSFFPQAPPTELDDIQGFIYPEPVEFPLITNNEVRKVILATSSKTAAGGDEIPNRILKLTLTTLLPSFIWLFNASLEAGYCPQHFRDSITISLRKPDKPDYQVPKAYRPIALLNTIGKALESIIATRLSWAAEAYELLPRGHMGGRRSASSEHAVHALIEAIHSAWTRKQVASLLLLDVIGAFDNVSQIRLLHNFRKRRIGGSILRWIASFLKDRTTILKLVDYITKRFGMDVGIPQGSPLSPILYFFYNSDLLEVCTDAALQSVAPGFIDDVAILVCGNTAEENLEKLMVLDARTRDWSSTHASKFDLSKYHLVHFRPKAFTGPELPLFLPGRTLSPEVSAKYLGIVLDSALTWGPHLNHLESKTTKKLAVLSALARSTWGVSLTDLRRTYISTVLPQFLYCVSAWYVPSGGHGYKIKEQNTLKYMRKVQARAGKIIAGAFKTTAGAALDIELFLRPVNLQLDIFLNDALLRIVSSPAYPYVRSLRVQPSPPPQSNPSSQQTQAYFKRLSPLHKLELRFTAIYNKKLDSLEKRCPFPTTPWYKAPIITIASSAKEATDTHDQLTKDPTVLAVYTDGSGINQKIGASAITLFIPYLGAQPMVAQTKQACLGTDEEFTVYMGELYGLAMACEIIAEADKTQPVHIFVDSRAAIFAVQNPRQQSGQYMLELIAKRLDTLRNTVHIHWIPAHTGVSGNEAADVAAKEATGWRAQGPPGAASPTPPHLHTLISACKTKVRARVDQQWEEQWKAEVRGRVTYKLTKKPTKHVLDKFATMSRPETSVLVQARTGKIGLRHYLYSIGAEDSKDCPCGEGPQTVQHVLLCCPEFDELREKMWEGKRETDLSILLGAPGLAKKAAQFLIETGELVQFRHVKQASPEDHVSDSDVLIGETGVEDSW